MPLIPALKAARCRPRAAAPAASALPHLPVNLPWTGGHIYMRLLESH